MIEICNLLEEEDYEDLYYFDGDVIIASVHELMQEGMVMFEDESGIFSLYAGQIIDIEPV